MITNPDGGEVPSVDVAKAVAKIYELTLLPTPPLRLVLGKDALRNVRKQLGLVADDVDTFESWSEDLLES